MGVFVVTGCTGFLGEHIVKRLVEQNHQVIGLSRNPGVIQVPVNARGKLTQLQGSVTDPNSLRLALSSGVDGIFHLAGAVEHSRTHASSIHSTNVDGTLQVIKAAARHRVPRIVYASTSGCVGITSEAPTSPITDDAPYARQLAAPWPYYASKIQAEEQGRRQAEALGIQLIAMRPSLLLGPGDKNLSSTRSVLDFLQRRLPLTPNGGLSCVDVRDAAEAFVTAMLRGAPGMGCAVERLGERCGEGQACDVDESAVCAVSPEAPMFASYLLGASNLTFADFFAHLEGISQVAAPRLQVPSPWAIAAAQLGHPLLRLLGMSDPNLDPVVVEMSSAYWYIDSSRAKSELDFQPRPLHETLRDTVAWTRAHHLA